jgi:hypothetical protein
VYADVFPATGPGCPNLFKMFDGLFRMFDDRPHRYIREIVNEDLGDFSKVYHMIRRRA